MCERSRVFSHKLAWPSAVERAQLSPRRFRTQDGYGQKWKRSLVEHCQKEAKKLPPIEGITHPVSLYIYHQVRHAGAAVSGGHTLPSISH